MTDNRPAWLIAAADAVATDQARTFACLIHANHMSGRHDLRDRIIDHIVDHRRDLVHGVILALLEGGRDATD